MSERLAIIHPDANTLAHAAAARLITRLLDLQSEQEEVNVALTGGSLGIATLAALSENPAKDAIDWSGVHLWWGDERFLPAGDPDRNETQARAALLDSIPTAQIHPVPVTGTPEEAAELYASELPEQMDITLLGMGPDGHVASLFPGRSLESAHTVIAVRESPKPPSERVSLTLRAINGSREVWLIVSGHEKAAALRNPDLPVAKVRGTEKTLLLADVAATSS